MSNFKITKYFPSWLLNIAIIFFIVTLLAVWLFLGFEKIYDHKIYPGIKLGQIDLSGITQEQAKMLINSKINSINRTGVSFYFNETQSTIMPTITSAEGDFAYQIIDFDVEQTINQAYGFGRNQDFFTNLVNKIKSLTLGQTINFIINFNQAEIRKMLTENFSQFEVPAQDAQLIQDENNNFIVTKENFGKIIEYDKAIEQLKINLLQLDDSPIQLYARIAEPQIYQKDCLNIDAKAKNIIALAPLTLNYLEQQWSIEQNQLSNWLALKINPSAKKQEEIIVGLNQAVVEQYLFDKIASTTDKNPVDAKFEILDGKVVEFQASQDGFKLNIAASFIQIENTLLEKQQSEIDLVKTELKSKVLTQQVNDFGINEIIGIGESNFAGSPVNRRHNIKNGANTLNGILIKPDEEFSLNNAIGEVDATTGYLPELVIKGNQTIPEYGGGLCQIGTTMFRVALATGLPITQRRNHSYRVRYYEPAGTDATIYNPWPDLKFINDTGHHILIQSRIEGDNLYFDFWGTNDGRLVEQTESVIYNITKPGPSKLIETLDLEPGKKRCTEHAVNGADAHFDYKVTYANGEVKEKTFTSHYVPWQEVCLIGVEELSSATSTEEVLE